MMDVVHIIQVLVPTRENVDAYVEHQQQVLEMAGRINAQQVCVVACRTLCVHCGARRVR
jgi:trehalose-6-phosphate synthase